VGGVGVTVGGTGGGGVKVEGAGAGAGADEVDVFGAGELVVVGFKEDDPVLVCGFLGFF